MLASVNEANDVYEESPLLRDESKPHVLHMSEKVEQELFDPVVE